MKRIYPIVFCIASALLSACSLIPQGVLDKIDDLFPDVVTPVPPDAGAEPVCPAECIPILCPTPTPTPEPSATPTPEPTQPPGASIVAGQDYLGIKSQFWNTAAMVQALSTLKEKITTGSLIDSSFGPNDANLIALFNTGKTYLHRVHLLNTTCVTNGVCGASDMLRGYSKGSIQSEAMINGSRLNQMICSQALKVKAWKAQYPGITFYISPLLEHHVDRNGMINIFNQLGVCLGGTQIGLVDSHQQAYPTIPGTFFEQHGINATAPFTSYDGNSGEDQDYEAYKVRNASGKASMFWSRAYNCRLEKGNFIQPNQRKDCPTGDQFTWFLRLQEKQDVFPTERPSWCPNPQLLTAPWLWKTSAENYGVAGDNRANKPVYITRYRAGQVDYYGKNGVVIGWARYYGPYGASNSGLYRYYLGQGSGDSALTLGDKARKQTGSSWVFTKEGGTCKAIDAYRRSGYMYRPGGGTE